MKSAEMIGLLTPEIAPAISAEWAFPAMPPGTCLQHAYITSQVPAEDGFAAPRSMRNGHSRTHR
jgi:hypothetical protein